MCLSTNCCLFEPNTSSLVPPQVFSISIKTTSYDSFEVVDDSGTQRIAHMDTLHLSFPEDGLLSLDSEEEKKVVSLETINR